MRRRRVRVAGMRWRTGGGRGRGREGGGSRWREECKGGLCRRPVESDEERAARAVRAGARERERERLRRARCAEGAWARIERERGRQRQIPCLTRLGSMRSSARTPRRPRPSFLPSFSLLRSSLPSPCYLTLSFSHSVSVFLYSCLSFRLPFTLSLSPSLLRRSPCPSFPVPLSLLLSQSLLLASFVLRAFTSCC